MTKKRLGEFTLDQLIAGKHRIRHSARGAPPRTETQNLAIGQ